MTLPAAAAGAGPVRQVRDGAGRLVTVPASPARIVSMAPSVTEILFAVGAGDRVVGVSDHCNDPPEARSRRRIGGLINPDLETIASLRPDLVVATTAGNYLDDAERIERLGIPVFTLGSRSLEDVLSSLEEAGRLVGAPQRGASLASSLRGRIGAARAQASGRPRPRTLFVIEPDPLIAPGRGTFVGEALEAAGADLVGSTGSSGWNQYDREQVLAMRPEVILTTEANAAWARGLAGAKEWRLVPAVRAGRVHVISDAIQRPGPRMVDGIEEVARILGGDHER